MLRGVKLNIAGASFIDPYIAVGRGSNVGGTTSCSGCATRLCTVKPKASIGRQYRSRGDGIIEAMQRRGLGEWANAWEAGNRPSRGNM